MTLKFKITRIVFLVITLILMTILIIESATPGISSANKSNGFGDLVIKLIDNIKGDQAKEIIPTKINITNKIENANTNEYYDLDVAFEPYDSTYKSKYFKSSNENVISVTQDGRLHFIKEGIATISCYSSYNNELSDNVVIKVSDVLATSIETEILNVNKTDDYYELYKGYSYKLKSTINPLNTTNKEVIYESDTSLIEINQNQICILDTSSEFVELKAKNGDVSNTIKLKLSEPLIPGKATNNLDLTFKINDTLNVSPTKLEIYKSDKLDLYTILDSDTTRSLINITSSNSNVISVINNELNIIDKGITTINVKEKYSSLEKEIKIEVKDKIVIDEINKFKFKSNNNYKFENNTLTIKNGDSIDVSYNFSNDTTYKITSYTSSDESIVLIGKDGMITPKQVGKAKITLKIDYEDYKYEDTFDIVIEIKSVIEDVVSFRYTLRKAVGHYGAFLVLALFATVTFLMFLRKKYWYMPLIASISSLIHGFWFAGFTEILQYNTPGRAGMWADVFLDFGGYATGFFIIFVINLICFLIIKIKNNKKNKKNYNITNKNKE